MNKLEIKHRDAVKIIIDIDPVGFEHSDIDDAIMGYLSDNEIQYTPENASPPLMSAKYTDSDGNLIWGW